jgi:hypothetical protein
VLRWGDLYRGQPETFFSLRLWADNYLNYLKKLPGNNSRF